MVDIPLSRRIKTLITFRVFFVTLLLGSFIYFQIGYGRLPYQKSIFHLIIALYFLTIVYSILFNIIKKRLFLFAYIQLLLDVVSGVILIFLTGGIESWFSMVMLLNVLSSAIILNKKAGFTIATVSGILYGIMIDLQFYGVLPVDFSPQIQEKEFFYNIFSNLSALYITAYFTGYLSTKLEKTTRTLKEKETDLEDLSIFNKEIIENMPSGLFTADLSGRIVIFNRAAEYITGVAKESATWLSVNSLFPFLSNPLQEGHVEGVIEMNREPRIISMAISILRDANGNTTGAIGIFQDFTQFRALEEEIRAKEKWAAIGELSTNMAHEIRNPLASLKGSIEMLKEDSLAKDFKEKLMGIALGEMDRLNKTITDFLAYSRPKNMELVLFDLNRVLDETLTLLLNMELKQEDISIKKNLGSPLMVNADRQRLQQAFWNLGLNAIDAMPYGGELSVSTMLYDNYVKIIFRDSGIGISPEDIRRIFNPFFTTKDKGTGLGLSIVYRIIEEHNGRINVKSSPQQGTAFEIVIPVKNGNP